MVGYGPLGLEESVFPADQKKSKLETQNQSIVAVWVVFGKLLRAL